MERAITNGLEASPVFRKFRHGESGFRWDDVPLKQYKEEGTHFRSITRQVLFSGDGDQPCELRYFEVAPGGHSTLEKHVHTHAIMIIRGRGRAILGNGVVEIEAFDLLHVPPMTWHQLLAHSDEALGFLCQVSCDRDRPIRPGEEDRKALLQNEAVSEAVRL
ncbi:MAG: cupin domain-containing protein [Rhodothermales bacterium]